MNFLKKIFSGLMSLALCATLTAQEEISQSDMEAALEQGHMMVEANMRQIAERRNVTMMMSEMRWQRVNSIAKLLGGGLILKMLSNLSEDYRLRYATRAPTDIIGSGSLLIAVLLSIHELIMFKQHWTDGRENTQELARLEKETEDLIKLLSMHAPKAQAKA